MQKEINNEVLKIWANRSELIGKSIGTKIGKLLIRKLFKEQCPYCKRYSKINGGGCVACPIVKYFGKRCSYTPFQIFMEYFYTINIVNKKLFNLCNDEIDFLKKVVEHDERS